MACMTHRTRQHAGATAEIKAYQWWHSWCFLSAGEDKNHQLVFPWEWNLSFQYDALCNSHIFHVAFTNWIRHRHKFYDFYVKKLNVDIKLLLFWVIPDFSDSSLLLPQINNTIFSNNICTLNNQAHYLSLLLLWPYKSVFDSFSVFSYSLSLSAAFSDSPQMADRVIFFLATVTLCLIMWNVGSLFS